MAMKMRELNQQDYHLKIVKDLGMVQKPEDSKKRRYAIFLCTCGNTYESRVDHISSKPNAKCKKCAIENIKISNKIANTKHGKVKTSEYYTWVEMRQRCNNPNNKGYKHYGERGITVCKEWDNFEAFYADMGERPVGMSIDRIDNNKGYNKDNCRWVTQTVQSRNTQKIRSNNTSGYRGVSLTPSEKWAAIIGLNGNIIYIGTFNTPLEAAKAYDEYVIKNNLEHTINGV